MQPRLAKLTRPRSEGLFPRARLFAQLDETRARPIVWLSAPPGAGKTSLVASYLEARKLRALWYQLDSADADPAAFFYYLRIAAAELLHGKKAVLPLFSQEHASDIAGFARLYFRELFSRLPLGCILVLDNYQDVPESSQLHLALQSGLEETPTGLNVIAVSRSGPPAELSRLRAAQRVALIEWDQLRLSLEETANIAAAVQQLPEATLQTLFEQTNGWAAGLTLVLERLKQTGQLKQIAATDNLETVFDYFAGLLFSGASEGTRETLLRMSYLPRLTAELAEAISGNPDAAKLLAGLSKRNLFVDRRYGEETSYQFHALFRVFLQSQARNTLGAAEHARLAHSAAALLQTAGQVEDAFPLYVETGAWDAAARLILKESERLLQQGRRQTLRRWIGSLPFEKIEEDPWLLYWLGTSLLGQDHVTARERFSAAYAGFERLHDREGQLAVASAAADSFFPERTNWSPIDVWIERLSALLDDDDASASESARSAGLLSLARALLYRQPDKPALALVMQRVAQLLDQEVSAGHKLRAGSTLLMCHYRRGEAAVCDAIYRRLQAEWRSEDAPAADRIYFGFWAFAMLVHSGRREEAQQVLDAGYKLTDDSGLAPLQFEFDRFRAMLYMEAGDFGAARRLLVEDVGPQLPRARLAAVCAYHAFLGICALGQGHPEEAHLEAETAVRISQQAGHRALETLYTPLLACTLIENGKNDDARKLLAKLRLRFAQTDWWWVECQCLINEAYALLREGRRDELRSALCAALPLLRKSGLIGFVYWAPQVLPQLLGAALELGIEETFARQLIARARLRSPSPDMDAWPRPIRIRGLGPFEVVIEGTPLDLGSRAPHKLLELLKALTARGGQPWSFTELMDSLWPDAEGDAASRSLDVSIHRLRKLLGREDAILGHDGKLSLNAEVCWTDVAAFERKANRLNTLPAADAGFGDLARNALELYGGHLLATEKEHSWLLGPRDQLRSRWQAVVRALGQLYESRTDWVEAAAVYRRALAIDPVAEELYRRLMVCLKETGNAAEGVNAFKRCKQELSASLGIAPSAETERIYKSLTGAH
ncbi:MAG TPA: BTAD domain-containing putative transcriptional regulator [Burkholderiales bacterium]|nr:BTAD domain-containing putative transcriptional regulator [Burkholderiales bacterium]